MWMKRFILLLVISSFMGMTKAQVDREFWFVVPVVTQDYPSAGAPQTFLNITTHDLPAHITIDMPKEPLFTPIQITIPAFTTQLVDLTARLGIIQNTWKPGGKNNKGLHIVSDNYINVTFESNKANNPETFTLFGRNALGSDFYTSFQTDMMNWNEATWTTQGYSAFDIVFTEDNTTIDLYIPAGKGLYNGGGPPLSGHVILGPFMRGETFTGIPAWLHNLEVTPKLANDVYGRSADDHLAGLRIVAQGGKKIAVTVKDDAVKSLVGNSLNPVQCDLLGDQIVPVTMLGKQYIALRGQLQTGSLATNYYNPPPANPVVQERLYILGVANNTSLYINGVFVATINAGETFVYPMSTDIAVVSSPNQPFYCYQVTGVGNELGDALLPPTDRCTGSSQVAFSRPSNTGALQLNILVRKTGKDSFLLNGLPSSLLETSQFTDIPGTDWAYLRNLSVPLSTIPFGTRTIISNTQDLFHIGIMNGVWSSSSNLGGARYAWLSEFNSVRFEGFISPDGTTYKRICYGDTVQLVAHGGTAYDWSPRKYLSDVYSPVPVARPDSSVIYTATISGACGLSDTVKYRIDVARPIEARFNIDTSQACAPYTLNIRDQSYGVKTYYWNLGDGTIFSYGSTESKVADTVLTHTYTNTGPVALLRNIQLIVENTYGCRDTLIRSFTINPEVTAGFNMAPGNTGCTPFTVAFTNTSARANSYQWSFGDNTSSSEVSPVHTYENYGPADSLRNIRLIATSSYYCSDTAFAQVTVRPFVKADFTVGPDKGCSPLQVSIQNLAVGGSSIVSYEWDFGDGNTSNSSAPVLTHTYTNTTGLVQIRQLRLVVINQQGCTDTLIRSVTVYPEVSAQFTQDVVQGCNPLTVSFTRPVNNAEVTWNWDFGQGSSSSNPDPIVVFRNAGGNDTTFTVRLIVTSANFCRDTFTRNITVYPYIDARFTIDRDEGCVTYPVVISNQSSVLPGISSFEWDFGDGSPLSNSNSATLNHTYSNPGAVTQTYNLRLVVRNHAGCTNTLIRPVNVFPRVISAFNPSLTAGCNPLTVSFSNTSNMPVASSFRWDFGTGATSSDVNPIYVFENRSSSDTVYRVRLIAVSSDQCTDTSRADITVYSFVKAAFTVDTNAFCSPFAVAISNASSGGISQFEWNFGDGSPVSNVLAPAHTYVNQTLAPQVHGLRLRVQNPHGCADSLERTITVYPEVRAAFAADVTAGCNPLTVQMTNQSNIPVAQVYYWEFGDGASSELQNPQHTFVHYDASDQIYPIHLHSVSQYGCSDDTTLNITVYSYVDADFKMNDQDVCSGFPLRFENTSMGGIHQVSWDFDGNGSVDSNDGSPFFDHPYTNLNDDPVSYNAFLRVNNIHGCADSVTRPVTVYPKVTASFAYDSAGCSPLEVQFANTSLRGSALLGSSGFYAWDFGDQTSSSLENPTKIFYNYNDFDITRTVKLIATSQYFCQDSVEKTVYVYHKPRAIFNVDRTIDCPPFNLSIQNNSYTTSAAFFWDYGDGQHDTTFVQSGLTHTYYNSADSIQNYNLRLRVQTNRNCIDSSALTVSVYPEVHAEFTYDSSGCSPFVAGFTNQSVHAAYFHWDFGDGSVSSLVNPVKRFVNPADVDATFDVWMKAASVYNCRDSVRHQVTVFAQPEAEFLATPPHQIYEPEPVVSISNLSNHQTVWDYQWDFGDGTSSVTQSPSFQKTYTAWGPNNDENRFYITLIATNTQHPQCADTITHPIRILPHVPVPEILTQDAAGCEPLEVTFAMQCLYAYPDSFVWDFGDGSVGTGQQPVHTYQHAGIYQVRLKAVGDGGVAYAFALVNVYPLPEADFDVSPRLVMLPDDKITVIDKSKYAVSWWWDFGDGTTSVEQQPQHQYIQPGSYDIRLIVLTEHNCPDTLLRERFVTVEESGILEFPNAFTPNLNGPSGGDYNNLPWANINDVFHPKHRNVVEFRMEIYTRWGEKIFETNDINVGWDGYYKGRLCKQDVYVWKASGKFINGRNFLLSGDVTLLHKK